MPDAPPTANVERTALAWQRTAISIAAGGVALTHWASGPGGWLTMTLSLLAFVTAATVLVISIRRGRSATSPERPSALVPLLTACAICLLGAGALARVLLS